MQLSCKTAGPYLFITLQDPDSVVVLPHLVPLFSELGHPDPVGVPQDVDVHHGAAGDDEQEQAQEQRKDPHRGSIWNFCLMSSGFRGKFHLKSSRATSGSIIVALVDSRLRVVVISQSF